VALIGGQEDPSMKKSRYSVGQIAMALRQVEDGTYWMPVNKGEPYYFVVRYYKSDVDNLPEKPCN